ncbi:MAG: hypothetical protein HRT61_00095 [Ekhidna sp.]|nr:hypothetical protein [Ekhidna sp.]
MIIAEKGFLTLDVESTMHLKLGPGRYDIEHEAERHNAWYATHLELTAFLKRENLLGCKFRYKTMSVPGSNRHYEMDRIELDQKGLVILESDSDSLVVNWNNPDYKYKGKYFVVIRDFHNNGFVDVIESIGNSITPFPAKYGHRHMFYSIIAKDCRASLRYKIEVLSVQSSGLDQTVYINYDQ